jgi:chromosome segregation ATPase
MSVTAGKEDNYQRKLFERENEIRMFRGEVQSLRE